jgi:hypothetical protein
MVLRMKIGGKVKYRREVEQSGWRYQMQHREWKMKDKGGTPNYAL